ncbi:MAG TPA: hypothetical protein VHU85_01200 [Acidimicrobiales bacterium]|nr:hypothetical protein [Acidimicrobiales bacterium]
MMQEAGQAVVMVIAMSVLLMTVGVMLVAQTIQTDPLLQANTIQHSAYRGLQAGMDSYQSILNTNPNLANCNTSTNGNALCTGAQYQKWNLVSHTDGGNGTIPEWYLFDNPQPVFNSDGSLSSLQVQIVGVAGFPSHYAFQSSVANLAPVNGFLTNLWWSDFQASDPNVSNPVYTGPNAVCKYNYANGYNGPGANCQQVTYGPTDVVNGPVFSNDSVYVAGAPNFGTSTNKASVKTADPGCLFVDGTSPPNCSSDVGIYNTATSADAQPKQTPPADDSSLKLVANQVAPNNGCVYYGPTTITLTGSTTAGTMTVVSPDTVTASTGCPLSNTGVNPIAGSLPPNGVIYIDNAVAAGNANSRVVTGANPFDDVSTYYPAISSSDNGKYAQTCGNYTINGRTMPCYFGWTGAATQDSEGDAFVSGSLTASSSVAGELTIGTANDIIIDGNLTYGDCTGNWVATAHQSNCNYRTDGKNDALGLIANQYVEVDHPIYPGPICQFLNFFCTHQTGDPLPNCGTSGALPVPLCTAVDSSGNVTIDAAILALTQSFGINNFASGSQFGNLILYGSVQQEARGAVGTFSGNSVVSGFSKYYTWDPRLELVAPPSYLNPGTASYNLNSSAISPSLLCPALKNVYGTAGTSVCPTVPAP